MQKVLGKFRPDSQKWPMKVLVNDKQQENRYGQITHYRNSFL